MEYTDPSVLVSATATYSLLCPRGLLVAAPAIAAQCFGLLVILDEDASLCKIGWGLVPSRPENESMKSKKRNALSKVVIASMKKTGYSVREWRHCRGKQWRDRAKRMRLWLAPYSLEYVCPWPCR